MEIAKQAAARSEQTTCEFKGCKNVFLRTHHNMKYCSSPECIAARSAARTRVITKDPDADNLVLAKTFDSGHIILVQCHATGVNGRCTDYYQIIYDKQRKIYPKFCPQHRNAYRRQRFQTVLMESNGKCQNLISEQSKLQTNLNTMKMKSSTEDLRNEKLEIK